MEDKNNFELADPNTKILSGHLCEKCKFILYNAHRCENNCQMFCEIHLPKSKLCTECGGTLSLDQKLSENIKKRYKVKCNKCDQKMMLEKFDFHLKEGCKFGCPQKCDSFFSSQQEIENHLKEECINSQIECFACDHKDLRGMINIHQLICKKALKFNDLIQPLKNKVESQNQEILSLKKEILSMKQG